MHHAHCTAAHNPRRVVALRPRKIPLGEKPIRHCQCQRPLLPLLPPLLNAAPFPRRQPLALVLPREAVAFPHVGPPIAAGFLARPFLKAVRLAGGIGLGRSWLVKQPAQVDKVLLRGRAFLEFGGTPFGDEYLWSHSRTQSG